MGLIRRRFMGRIGGDPQGQENAGKLFAAGNGIRVYLNGKEVGGGNLTGADSNEGWVEMLVRSKHSFLVSQRMTGNVEIYLEKPRTPRVPGAPWEW